MNSEWLTFLEEIKRARHQLSCANSGAWYRGCSCSTYSLKPKLFRGDYSPYLERAIYMGYVRFFGDCKNSWDILINMQHYGTPTRLLDWTENFSTALFFALCDTKSTSTPTIWILNPFTLSASLRKENNKNLMDVYNNPALDYFQCHVNLKEIDKDNGHIVETNFGHKWLFEKPVPFVPPTPVLNQRIISQRGFFTIHGVNWKVGMEENCKSYLKKIVLPAKAIDEAKHFLELSGTDYLRMYPDFEGFAKHMTDKYNQISKINI